MSAHTEAPDELAEQPPLRAEDIDVLGEVLARVLGAQAAPSLVARLRRPDPQPQLLRQVCRALLVLGKQLGQQTHPVQLEQSAGGPPGGGNEEHQGVAERAEAPRDSSRSQLRSASDDEVEACRERDMLQYKVHQLEGEVAELRLLTPRLEGEVLQCRSLATTLRTQHATERNEWKTQSDEVIGERDRALRDAADATRERDSALAKAAEAEERLGQVQTQYAQQTQAFTAESDARASLVELLERRVQVAERASSEAIQQEQSLRQTLADTQALLEQERTARATNGGTVSQQDTGHDVDQTMLPAAPSSPTAAAAEPKAEPVGATSRTSLFAQFVQAQEDLTQEKHRSSQLATALETFLAQLRARQSVLQAQNQDAARTKAQLHEMGHRLASTARQGQAAEERASQLQKQAKEAYLAQQAAEQHIADLERQVSELLSHQHATQELPAAVGKTGPLHGTSVSTDSRTAPTEPGADEDPDTTLMLASGEITFRSLSELVARNGSLLKRVRALARTMRDERQSHTEDLARRGEEAQASIVRATQQHEEQLHLERARVGALERERDMLRSLRQPPANAQADGHLPATSVATIDDATGSTSAGSGHRGDAEQLAALKVHFANYQTETEKDSELLKTDLAQARAQARKDSLLLRQEQSMRRTLELRLQNVQKAYERLKIEGEEVGKMVVTLRDNLSKRDGSAQYFVQQLAETQESLALARKEAVQWTLDRQALEDSRARLERDNQALQTERANLADLLGKFSRAQSEHERRASAKLESCVAQLARHTQAASEAQQQATAAQEELSHIKEQLQTRISELEQAHTAAQEELQASRTRLASAEEDLQGSQQKAGELQQKLENREEKLSVFERHAQEAAARAGAQAMAGGDGAGAGAGTGTGPASADQPDDSNLGGATSASASSNREQVLEITIADLRTEMRSAQEQAARAQAEMAQAQLQAEEAHKACTLVREDAQQQRAQWESELATKQAEVDSLQTSVNDAQVRVTVVQSELDAVRAQCSLAQEQAEKARNEKAQCDATYASVDERVLQETAAAREEAQAYAERAKQATEKFQSEVVAHAQDVRTLHQLREMLKQAQAHQVPPSNPPAGVAPAGTIGTTDTAGIAGATGIAGAASASGTTGTTSPAAEDASVLATLQQANVELEERVAKLGRALSEGLVGGNEVALSAVRDEQEILRKQSELHKHELARWRAQAQATAQALTQAQNDLAQLQSHAAGRPNERDQTSVDTQVRLLTESNTTLRERMGRSDQRVRLLESELALVKGKLSESEALVAQVQGDLAQSQEQHTALGKQAEEAQSKVTLWESKLGNVDDVEDRIRSISEQADCARKELESVRIQLSEALRQGEEHAMAKSALESRISQLHQTHGNSEAQLGEANERIQSLEARLTETSAALEKAQATTAEGKARFQTLRQQTIDRLKAKTEEAAEVKAQLQGQADELRQRLTQQEQAAAEARAQLEEQIRELQGRSAPAENQGAEHASSAAHESATGPEKNVAVSPEDATKARSDAASAQAEGIDSQDKDQRGKLLERIAHLESELIRVQTDRDQLQKQLAASQASQPLTQEASEFNAEPESAISKPDWEKERTNLLSRLSELEQRKTLADEQMERVTRELEASQAQLAGANEQRASQVSESESTKTPAVDEKLASSLAQKDGELKKLQTRVMHLEQQVSELQAQLGEATSQVSAAQEAHQAAVAQLSAEQEALTKLRGAHEEMEDAHKKLQSAHQVAEQAHTAALRERDELLAQQLAEQAQKQAQGQAQGAERATSAQAVHATDHAKQISEAVSRKEKELAEAHEHALQARFDAGKQEAQLRFKLLDNRKTAQITALKKQIDDLTSGADAVGKVDNDTQRAEGHDQEHEQKQGQRPGPKQEHEKQKHEPVSQESVPANQKKRPESPSSTTKGKSAAIDLSESFSASEGDGSDSEAETGRGYATPSSQSKTPERDATGTTAASTGRALRRSGRKTAQSPTRAGEVAAKGTDEKARQTRRSGRKRANSDGSSASGAAETKRPRQSGRLRRNAGHGQSQS